MKFLKTFLFTISFLFLSFGFVHLRGFCASIALDVGSASTVGNAVGSSFNFASASQFNVVGFTEAVNEINRLLYANYGWDLMDVAYKAEDYWNSGQGSSLVADNYADIVSRGAYKTWSELAGNGYAIYNGVSQIASSSFSNLKQNIAAQYNSVTGKLENALANTFVKINSGLLQGISQPLDTMVEDKFIEMVGSNTYLYCGNCRFSSVGSPDLNQILQANISTTEPVYFFTCTQFMNGSNRGLCCAVPSSYVHNYSSYYRTQSCVYVDAVLGNGSEIHMNPFARVAYTYTINGESYTCFVLTCSSGSGSAWYYQPVMTNFSLGDFPDYQSFVNSVNNSSVSSPSVVTGYDYANRESLQEILDKLYLKYIDTDSLQKIVDIINSFPIDVVTEEGVSVPVVNPTAEGLVALDEAVDEAIAIGDSVADIWEDYGVAEVGDTTAEPEPEPGPIPDYTGTAVPEDFPTTIFSPISDSVGSIFDFVSIFEPLFYIFSFSTGLLGLWLVIPFVILFLILFRMLK